MRSLGRFLAGVTVIGLTGGSVRAEGPAERLAGLPCLTSSVSPSMFSSFSRAGLNVDFLAASDPVDPHLRPYLYRDGDGRFVLLDVSGPGAITRMWMTQLSPGTSEGDLTATGRVQVFLDGDASPRVDLPATEFFSGTVTPFLTPLCGDWRASSGGNYCMVRMPFRSRAVIAVTGRPNFWNFQYETYPTADGIETFDPSDTETVTRLEDTVALWARAGENPQILPAGVVHQGNTTIDSGMVAPLLQHSGAGTLGALEVSLVPHDDAALASTWLEATWDDAPQPQIAAPLSEIFLSGAGDRFPAKGLLAGYRPDLHRGYLYFPMPFSTRAELVLRNRGEAPVEAAWRIEESPRLYDDVGRRCGVLRATFAENPQTASGDDHPLLEIEGARGRVVGFSFTEEGPHAPDLTVFLEGDERVYVDGSLTPQIHGTGTEDIFNGGFYYNQGPFTRPSHGMSAKEAALGGAVVAQYRLLLSDPWDFRSGIRIGFEHGGGDGVPTRVRSLVYWYGIDEPAMRRTDLLDVGNAASEQAHAYEAVSAISYALSSFYDGDRDGNVSSFAQDAAIFPGALPVPTDVRGQAVSDDGRFHTVDSRIRFQVQLSPENRGAVLRRRLDQVVFDQRAEILVDGAPAGVWAAPRVNDLKRWVDADLAIPAALTAGKDEITVELRILDPVDAPPVSPPIVDPPQAITLPTTRTLLEGGWTDFRYEVFSITQ